MLMTVGEVATLLRTTPKAIYCMAERNQLPSATRIGRRLLFHRDDMLRCIDRNRAPSSKETRR
jgi:excisionase family DNA binding protein